jgi:hypothetical protein
MLEEVFEMHKNKSVFSLFIVPARHITYLEDFQVTVSFFQPIYEETL